MKKGGALPLRYFDASAYHPDATEGVNMLQAGELIRPKIGGRRKRKTRRKRTKGGFIPTVMEPFVSGVSKYIVPLVLYSGYKLMSHHTGKSRKSRKSRK